MEEDKKPRRVQKKPKKITPRYLDNVAAYYLARYASSSVNLKRVLMRRAQRSCAYHESPLEEAEEMIDALVERYCQAGFLNDESYALNLARTLRAKGKSARMILQKMYEKGIDPELAQQSLKATDSNLLENAETVEDAEDVAAWRFARRRKLGPFRAAADRSDYREKDLGRLARAGFSYGTARSILDQDDVPEEIADLIR
ncbi:MAG: RecX family transcriptional regulator [Pseudomonadota bacterium]|nr:RecX family transcriptional regulator [Pseudomonadota bacterium]QKK05770.1 MAG: RecX family transcriptional regulator [Pseudomonadota bacterium]